jgi:hypothetical protein
MDRSDDGSAAHPLEPAARGVSEANAPMSNRCHSKTRATKVAGKNRGRA